MSPVLSKEQYRQFEKEIRALKIGEAIRFSMPLTAHPTDPEEDSSIAATKSRNSYVSSPCSDAMDSHPATDNPPNCKGRLPKKNEYSAVSRSIDDAQVSPVKDKECTNSKDKLARSDLGILEYHDAETARLLRINLNLVNNGAILAKKLCAIINQMDIERKEEETMSSLVTQTSTAVDNKDARRLFVPLEDVLSSRGCEATATPVITTRNDTNTSSGNTTTASTVSRSVSNCSATSGSQYVTTNSRPSLHSQQDLMQRRKSRKVVQPLPNNADRMIASIAKRQKKVGGAKIAAEKAGDDAKKEAAGQQMCHSRSEDSKVTHEGSDIKEVGNEIADQKKAEPAKGLNATQTSNESTPANLLPSDPPSSVSAYTANSIVVSEGTTGYNLPPMTFNKTSSYLDCCPVRTEVKAYEVNC
uniref:TPX2 domain-containing protein n=1 Tax=Rhabditophanes sp. KR3021 TaxID=114890 RepID=A0AC35TZE0_9BILA